MRVLSRRAFMLVTVTVLAAVAGAEVAQPTLADGLDFRLDQRDGGFAVTFRKPAVWPVRSVGCEIGADPYIPAANRVPRRYMWGGQMRDGGNRPDGYLLSTLTNGNLYVEVRTVRDWGYVLECEVRHPGGPRRLLWSVEHDAGGVVTYAATICNQPVADAIVAFVSRWAGRVPPARCNG